MGLLVAAAVVAILSLAAVLLSNFNWRSYHKGQLAGPKWVWPIVGATLYCITDPYGYWITQRNYGKLSWNSLFGQFLIVAGDVASCRSVLTQTGYVSPFCATSQLPGPLQTHCTQRHTADSSCFILSVPIIFHPHARLRNSSYSFGRVLF